MKHLLLRLFFAAALVSSAWARRALLDVASSQYRARVRARVVSKRGVGPTNFEARANPPLSGREPNPSPPVTPSHMGMAMKGKKSSENHRIIKLESEVEVCLGVPPSLPSTLQ